MNDEVDRNFLEEPEHARAIANVDLVMLERLARREQLIAIRARVTAGTEKVHAHVVVDAVDGMTLRAEIAHGFRPDESAAARNQDVHAGEN